MSVVAKVSITYIDTSGVNRTLSYKGTSTSFDDGLIAMVCNSLAQNGSILKYPVSEVIGAKLVTTVEEELDIS